MDTYCLVVEPGQATHYGGVVECELTDTELRLVLTERAAGTLGMPQHTRFVLDLPPGQREILGSGFAAGTHLGPGRRHPSVAACLTGRTSLTGPKRPPAIDLITLNKDRACAS